MVSRHLVGCVCALLILVSGAGQAQAAPMPESFAPLVEKLSPAVVNISTTQKIKDSGGALVPFGNVPPDHMDEFRDFLERFGGVPGGGELPEGGMKERDVHSLGSGFVIDPAGYVVTNNHVIDGAKEIRVKFLNKKEYPAKIVGRDPKTDLALLKIESKTPLPFVSFGDSDAARVGDWIIAIGNPFGLGGSVTAGIISARERNINAGPFDDFIQTDAAINRGNSGGPMFNTNGEVIGINSAIFSPSGGNVGIGFAVPSALAEPVLKQLRTEGRTHRGWLGVKIQMVSEEIANSLGLEAPKGALVMEVTANSPASKANIKVGDVILQFNQKEIEEMHMLPRQVAETKIGSTVPVVVWRDGKRLTVSVTLGELKEEEQEASADTLDGEESKPAVASRSLLGMQLVELSPSARKEMADAGGASKGVQILKIDPESAGAQKGLRRGDVITGIGQQEIASVDDLFEGVAAAKKGKRKFVLLRVWRGGESSFVTLPVTENIQ